MIKKEKKVSVKKVLTDVKKEKTIFIPNLNLPIKKNFNLILSDSSGEYNITIKKRDSRGKISATKTITFSPGKSLNLLGEFNEKDLIDSRELQIAINSNKLKYVEEKEETKQFDKPSIVTFEDRIKPKQETPTSSIRPLESISSAASANSSILIPSDTSFRLLGPTYFSIKIYPADASSPPPGEQLLREGRDWSKISAGVALIKIPLITNKQTQLIKLLQKNNLERNSNFVRTDGWSSNFNTFSKVNDDSLKEIESIVGKISFKILSVSPNLDSAMISGQRDDNGNDITHIFKINDNANSGLGTSKEIELWLYLRYTEGLDDLGQEKNDLGKTFKINIEATFRNEDGSISKTQKQYTLTTEPQSPLVRSRNWFSDSK